MIEKQGNRQSRCRATRSPGTRRQCASLDAYIGMGKRGLLATALLVGVAACQATTTPASAPATATTTRPTELPSPSPTQEAEPQALGIEIATDASRYPSSGATLQISLSNNSDRVVYLPVCGPWEVASAGDPTEPVWLIVCEIDYLGHRIEPGQVLADSLSLELEAGAYQVQTMVYADCQLGEPREISARETYYGEFSACAIWQQVASPTFHADP